MAHTKKIQRIDNNEYLVSFNKTTKQFVWDSNEANGTEFIGVDVISKAIACTRNGIKIKTIMIHEHQH